MSKTIATMKKMIKNLMLVAVAAMAFVGCQQDIEVNSITKKTTIDFIASFETETRSHFVENEDGTIYNSVWDGGEQVSFFAWDGGTGYAEGTTTMNTVDGTTGTFTAEFEGTVPAAGTFKAFVPAAAWNINHETVTIPAEQIPSDDSVDPAAHILSGVVEFNDFTTVNTSEIMFTHAVAYGKMTISDMTRENIDYINITIDGAEYTINAIDAQNLTASTFWFACNADDNVNNLRIEVRDGAKTYARTYEFADGKFAFKNGRVSEFSVKNLVEEKIVFTTASAEPVNSNYLLTFANETLTVKIGVNTNGKDYLVEKLYNYMWAGDYVNDGKGNTIMDGFEWEGYTMENAIPTLDVKVVDGKYNITINVTEGNKMSEATFVGDIEGLGYYVAEEVKDTATATLVTDTTFNGHNPYDVTFEFATGEKVTLRFNTSGNNYIHVGDWQSDDWQATHYISDVKLVGGNPGLNSCNVAYENDEYTITMSMYDWDNSKNVDLTYVGAIEGLVAPEECDCFAGGGDEPETGATELKITGHGIGYTGSGEYEILFIDSFGDTHVIDFLFSNGAVETGTFSSNLGNLAKDYCKYRFGASDGNVVMTDVNAIVTDNGNNNFTFDVTFEANGTTYHFVYTGNF